MTLNTCNNKELKNTTKSFAYNFHYLLKVNEFLIKYNEVVGVCSRINKEMVKFVAKNFTTS